MDGNIPASDREVTPADNGAPVALAGATDPLAACTIHVDDLYLEAGNWCDGQAIESAEQAAVVDRLLEDFKAAIKAAEDARDAIIAPLNVQIKDERERWYPLIGETTKITGKAIRAKKALLEIKTAWGNKERARQAVEAQRLRDEATEKARLAAEAARAAVGDLAATEQAEDLVRDAQASLRSAKQAEKPTVKGMRTVWRTEVTDPVTAMTTMWNAHRDEMLAYALQLAQRDVREGKRRLAGFAVTEDSVAI